MAVIVKIILRISMQFNFMSRYKYFIKLYSIHIQGEEWTEL
jgi:hypothetical protein